MSIAFPIDHQRVALVTGANTGIGLVTAAELARRGYQVYVTCRSRDKGEATLRKIQERTGKRAKFIELDLADLGSVRRAAEAFLNERCHLHLLVNNAGVARLRGVASNGFETTFATNHLGTFLFTNLLLPRMLESGAARIVTVASTSHYMARGIPWQELRQRTSYTGLKEYAVSKLANVLFSAELGRRLQGTTVRTYSLHPGAVATDVWRNAPRIFQGITQLFLISVEEGAKTSLHCATSPAVADETGLYYDRCDVRTPSEAAQDKELASELWQKSIEWTRLAEAAQDATIGLANDRAASRTEPSGVKLRRERRTCTCR